MNTSGRFGSLFGKLSGVSAILCVAAFAGMAVFVQRSTYIAPDNAVRKPLALESPPPSAGPMAEVHAAVIPEVPQPPLSWRSRLSLGEAQLEPIVDADGAEANLQKVALRPTPSGEGAYVQELGDGHRVLFTFDAELQQSAQTIFRNHSLPYAAAVVLDLTTADVLALVGHSSVDPQVDPLEMAATPWAPAASVFKLITAASLLEHKKATADTRVCFHGGLRELTDSLLRDNPKLDRTCDTLAAAIAQSHNVVIAKLALRHLDRNMLTTTAQKFLFESPIPFDLPVKPSPAFIPEEAMARARVAAGFWHVDMSPVHAAMLTSIIARGGTFVPPRILAQVRAPDGSDLTPVPHPPRRVIDRDIAEKVGQMMIGTTEAGTAKRSFRDHRSGTSYVTNAVVAGKTGSLTGKRPPAYNYNWFVAFAPAEAPEVAVAVLLANPPKWEIKAHYAARRLIQVYFSRRDVIQNNRLLALTRTAVVRPPRPGATTKSAVADGAEGIDARRGGRGTRTRAASDAALELEDDGGELPPVPGALPKPPVQ